MVTHANPSTVWHRINNDVRRLREWANRSANEVQKNGVEECVAALSKLAPMFDNIILPAPTKPTPQQSLAYRQGEMAHININQFGMDTPNPYDEQSVEFNDWQVGYDSMEK